MGNHSSPFIGRTSHPHVGPDASPALTTIARDLNTGVEETQIFLSIFMLAFAFGPMILSPLAEVFGRHPVCIISSCFYILWNTVGGFSRSPGLLIASRILSRFEASAEFAISNPVLADCWHLSERGKSLDSYAIHQKRYIQEATRQSLITFTGFKKGKANKELFESFMMRREYDMALLHVALRAKHQASYGFFCKNVVRALVKAGADVNAVDGQGRNYLAYAGQDAALVRFLLENGAKADAHVLCSAIDKSNVEVLEALLSAGVNANTRQPNVEGGLLIPKERLPLVHLATTTRQIPGWYNLGAGEQAALQIARAKILQTLLAHGADSFATFLQRQVHYQSPEDSGDRTVSVSYFSNSHDRQSHVPDAYMESIVLRDRIKQSISVEPFLKLAELDVDRHDPRGKTLLLSACSS
ncbi:hypothetical protein F5B21DRAFT_508425 [Xylaria acuta]|nr:hypothetical protein F5B21DRAFT_508425 [Xylaria acuta]